MIIFTAFGIFTILCIAYIVYRSEYRVHKEYQLEAVRKVNAYIDRIIQDDGQDFISFAKLLPEYADDMHIPLEITDYNDSYEEFSELFTSSHPGESFGKDFFISDLEDEVLCTYLEYDYKYWTLTLNSTREEFGLTYLYILVPHDEDGRASYIVDVFPTERPGYPGEMEVYYTDEPEENDEEEVPILWETWRTGKETDEFQVWDNEYGHTYSYYTPLIINGEKLGLIVGEIEVEKVNNIALKNALILLLALFILYSLCAVAMYLIIRFLYVRKLMLLNNDVREFSRTKDYSIADRISSRTSTAYEISSLFDQTSEMIKEIKKYVDDFSEVSALYSDSVAREAVTNQLAYKDSLTGAYNKTAYDNMCEGINNLISGGNTNFGIAMIDLNFLKKINDTYGHQRGNAALMTLYELICDIYPAENVFRIGGDEFVVVLEGVSYDNALEDEAEFKAKISVTSRDENLRPWSRTSAAIGVALFDPESEKSIDDTFKRADELMYEYKKKMKAVRKD